MAPPEPQPEPGEADFAVSTFGEDPFEAGLAAASGMSRPKRGASPRDSAAAAAAAFAGAVKGAVNSFKRYGGGDWIDDLPLVGGAGSTADVFIQSDVVGGLIGKRSAAIGALRAWIDSQSPFQVVDARGNVVAQGARDPEKYARARKALITSLTTSIRQALIAVWKRNGKKGPKPTSAEARKIAEDLVHEAEAPPQGDGARSGPIGGEFGRGSDPSAEERRTCRESCGCECVCAPAPGDDGDDDPFPARDPSVRGRRLDTEPVTFTGPPRPFDAGWAMQVAEPDEPDYDPSQFGEGIYGQQMPAPRRLRRRLERDLAHARGWIDRRERAVRRARTRAAEELARRRLEEAVERYQRVLARLLRRTIEDLEDPDAPPWPSNEYERALQLAYIARHSYSPSDPVPEPWAILSMGTFFRSTSLSERQLNLPSGLQIQVYKWPGPGGPTVVAFTGTETEDPDLGGVPDQRDFDQWPEVVGVGRDSWGPSQYRQGGSFVSTFVDLFEEASGHDSSRRTGGVVLTGHSLGGGVAMFAGLANNLLTYTFNPSAMSGQSIQSLPHGDRTIARRWHRIRNFTTSGDALTTTLPSASPITFAGAGVSFGDTGERVPGGMLPGARSASPRQIHLIGFRYDLGTPQVPTVDPLWGLPGLEGHLQVPALGEPDDPIERAIWYHQMNQVIGQLETIVRSERR